MRGADAKAAAAAAAAAAATAAAATNFQKNKHLQKTCTNM